MTDTTISDAFDQLDAILARIPREGTITRLVQELDLVNERLDRIEQHLGITNND